MAKLRLFANLREAAGTSRADFPGQTVGDVLQAARTAYGEGFSENMAIAKVWVNGEPADESDPVTEHDEIALIPPVSGGTVATRPVDRTGAFLVVALAVALSASNSVGTGTFVFAVVGAALAWLWDTTDVLRLRHVAVSPIPLMIGATAAANGAYGWGAAGFAGGVVIAVMLTLIWAVLLPKHRSTRSVAVSTSLAVIGSLATGSMVLTHLQSLPTLNAALAVTGAAAFTAWGVHQSGGEVGGLDPNVGMVLGAVIAGIISVLAADTLELTTMLLASAAASAGMIAGKAFGSLVRTGSVLHTARAPGLLTMFDGATIGIASFWAAVWVFG